MKRSEKTEDGAHEIVLYTCPIAESGCVILAQDIYKGEERLNHSFLTLCPEDMKALIKEFKKYIR